MLIHKSNDTAPSRRNHVQDRTIKTPTLTHRSKLPPKLTMGCASSKTDQLTPLTTLSPPRPQYRQTPTRRSAPGRGAFQPQRALPPMANTRRTQPPLKKLPPPNPKMVAYHNSRPMPAGPIKRKPVAKPPACQVAYYSQRQLPPRPVGKTTRGFAQPKGNFF